MAPNAEGLSGAMEEGVVAGQVVPQQVPHPALVSPGHHEDDILAGDVQLPGELTLLQADLLQLRLRLRCQGLPQGGITGNLAASGTDSSEGAEILLQVILQGFTDDETLILILSCLGLLTLRETPSV